MFKRKSNRGFTLIELIVVLMIVVGLATVLIPAITDMVSRTHTSTVSANISEVAGSIQRYEAQYFSYPNNMDGLVTDLTGTDLNTLHTGLTAVTADVTLTALTRAPLTASGITSIGVHAVDDVTFELPTATALTNTTLLKGLTTAAQEALGLETAATSSAGKYVVFGIGSLCDMNGKTMLDAPVHFPSDSASSPNDVYSRFIAVFQITDGTDPLSRAKLVAVISPTGEGLGTQIKNYFTVASAD